MKKRQKILCLGLLAVVLTSCAGVNPVTEAVSSGSTSVALDPSCLAEPAGFFSGWWHGATAFFAFVGHLFGSEVRVYEACNTGGWYDFGFLLGVGVFAGGSYSTR